MRFAWSTVAYATVAMIIATYGVAPAEDYGNLKMTIVLAGDAPKPKPLAIAAGVAGCGAPVKLPVDEELVVSKSGGVKNVILMLVPDKSQQIKPHPSYDEVIKKEVVVDNKNCRFEPHVAVVHTGQDLVLKNSDTIGHNSKIDFMKNTPINPSMPAGGSFTLKGADLSKAESRPIIVSCSIHPWMQATIVVLDHPYVAVSDENGAIEMKNIPVGKHKFQLRHNAYVLTKGKVEFGARGMAEIAIAKGDNDLGEFKMPLPKEK